MTSKVVEYSRFREKQRVKKYGDPCDRLRGRGFPDDFNPFQEDIVKPVEVVRCEKHKNYKRKPTWKCEDCRKEQEMWEKVKK